jgi:DNA anti-recombination protein RmuC
MIAVLSAVIGLVVGAALTWSFAQRQSQRSREMVGQFTAQLAVRESELANARENVERLRQEHDEQLKNLGPVFQSLSHEVLKETVHEFNQSQEQLMRERETTLDRTLKPLADLLDEYKRNLAVFDKQHVGALG